MDSTPSQKQERLVLCVASNYDLVQRFIFG